jgi:tetratricopeptide (TPR) repeat protein
VHHRLMPPVFAALAGALSACGGHPALEPARDPLRPVEPAAVASSTAPRTETVESSRLADRASSLLAEAKRWRERQRVLLVQMFALDEVLKDSSEGAERLAARRSTLATELERATQGAIAAYLSFVDDPALEAWPGRDVVLIHLARALREAGDTQAAAARLIELTERHPGSPLVPEADAALADLAFAAGRLDEARLRCDRVIAATPPSPRRLQALYMKSWSLRGIGDERRPGALDEAMQALREVIRLEASGVKDPGGLAATAAQELVELYALHGDPSDAQAFFAGAGRDGPRLLTLLAARYQRDRRAR